MKQHRQILDSYLLSMVDINVQGVETTLKVVDEIFTYCSINILKATIAKTIEENVEYEENLICKEQLQGLIKNVTET